MVSNHKNDTAVQAILVGIIALVVRVGSLGTLTSNYDEGVYYASLRSLAHGHLLYAQIYHAQPPYFLPLLLPFYLLGGHSLIATRAGVLLYSLVGIAAMGWLTNTLWGKTASYIAMIWLAIDPVYVALSIAVQAEVPALAFMLIAVASAAYFRKTQQSIWAIVTGIALVVSMGIKLFTVPSIVPIGFFLLEPYFSLWRPQQHWTSNIRECYRQALPMIVPLAIGITIGMIPLIAFILPAPAAAYQQIIGLHARATTAYADARGQNVPLFLSIWWEGAVVIIAALNAWQLWRKRQRDGMVLVIWGTLSIVVLAIQTPLFDHHLVLIVPPFIAAACCIQENLLHLQPKSLLYWSLAAILSVAFIAHDRIIPTANSLTTERKIVTMVIILQNFTTPDQQIITDDQLPVALAQRSIPPALDDTSLVRIRSGALTAQDVITQAQQPSVAAILWESGRFDILPGLKTWVEQHFTCVFTFDAGQCLYLKNTPGGKPVADTQ